MPAATLPTTTPVATEPARAHVAWPSPIETVLAVVAVVAILPWFGRLGLDDSGRDSRYAGPAPVVEGIPPPALPELCVTHARLAAPPVRERLCGRSAASSSSGDAESMPGTLVERWRRLARAFDAAQVTDIRPLACAFEAVHAAASTPARNDSERSRVAKANAILLLGAAMDGHGATAGVAVGAALPVASRAAARHCNSLSLPEALARGAAVVADAQAAALLRAKNEAMRDLLATAGWQWAAWMLAGLALVKLSRTRLPTAVGVSVALGLWAVAAWVGRVPWPLAHDRSLEVGRVGPRWDAMPADFVLALLAAAVVLLALSPWLRKGLAPVPQTLASRIGYPGFVVATGIAWLLLLDLSVNGPPGNRYLALYHHGHLWLAMLALTVAVFLRPAAGRALAWLLSVIDELGSRIGRALGPLLTPAAVVLVVLVILVMTGALLTGIRQFTSELGRVWLIVGVGWFFFLRGAPVAERLARRGNRLASLVRYAWPLAFVALVLVGMMLVTRDMGPLLVASYAAGAFLAASMAMWWHVRTGAMHAPSLLAVLAFGAWIVAVTFAVFRFGAVDEVTAGRLESLAAPLASANDQLALVGWFRQAAPAEGFGLGAIPWCGFGSGPACSGVPAQIQSDYTFTALVGAFGWAGAWAITLGCALWLHRLVRHHGRATRGEPRFVRRSDRVVADHQAFLSWIGVTWVVLTLCQLAVTVAGNLAVLPLTGVTFPFVSFGMTSLVVNSALLALCLNVNVPGKAHA